MEPKILTLPEQDAEIIKSFKGDAQVNFLDIGLSEEGIRCIKDAIPDGGTLDGVLLQVMPEDRKIYVHYFPIQC